MNIHINGEPLSLSNQEQSVAAALGIYLTAQQALLSFAVALNGEFVSKDDYATTALRSGDSLDVLFPIQGG